MAGKNKPVPLCNGSQGPRVDRDGPSALSVRQSWCKCFRGGATRHRHRRDRYAPRRALRLRHEPALRQRRCTPQPLTAPQAWAMLLALVSGFALSQAFRTITAIMATGLQAEFGLSAQALGVFAGTFAFAFGTMQLSWASPSTSGAFGAPCWWRFRWRLRGCAVCGGHGLQHVAAGAGADWGGLCACLSGVHGVHRPLLCAVALRRRVRRSHGVGGLGMLFTGTPLAWLVEQSSWRWGLGCWRAWRHWPGL